MQRWRFRALAAAALHRSLPHNMRKATPRPPLSRTRSLGTAAIGRRVCETEASSLLSCRRPHTSPATPAVLHHIHRQQQRRCCTTSRDELCSFDMDLSKKSHMKVIWRREATITR